MKKEIQISYEYHGSKQELSEVESALFDAASKARLNAYAPYSDFSVGCAILLQDGQIITGNNQENAAYPSGMCAERTTIYYTSANHPNSLIQKIFVVGGPNHPHKRASAIPPCGACRQSLLEYEQKQNADIEIYFASVEGEVYKTNSVKDLLPFIFDGTFLEKS